MGILFYLVFVGAGLTAAFFIQKALKAIKLIWIKNCAYYLFKVFIFNHTLNNKDILNIKNIEIDLNSSDFK